MSYLVVFLGLAGTCFYFDWSLQLSALISLGGVAVWAMIMNRRLAMHK